MTHGTGRKLCYDDLARMPDDDGLTRELLDGELFMTPAPGPLHQRVSKRLQRQLESYFERRNLGEVFSAPLDVILGRHDVPQPDLVVVTDSHLITDRAVEGSPVLVVEILSPSTASRDRTLKASRYAAAGVVHYWIVDPRRHRIECLRLTNNQYGVVLESSERDATLIHPEWPGLVIDLRKLWAPAPGWPAER
jgi:Uma2 family endonuclease